MINYWKKNFFFSLSNISIHLLFIVVVCHYIYFFYTSQILSMLEKKKYQLYKVSSKSKRICLCMTFSKSSNSSLFLQFFRLFMLPYAIALNLMTIGSRFKSYIYMRFYLIYKKTQYINIRRIIDRKKEEKCFIST